MKNINASEFANDFAIAIEEKFNAEDTYPTQGAYEITIIEGRVYDKICIKRAKYAYGESVHAFVKRDTGDLIKAASRKAPQKNSDGTLAVRYNLATPEGFQKALENANWTGAYLYVR